LAAWPQAAFTAKSVADALGALGEGGESAESAQIKIKAPDIAENGAVVPVTVSTDLGSVDSISILAEQNNNPLTSRYELGAQTEGYVSTRIKMGKTSQVLAVVNSGGKLYRASKEVKVTIGGCGG
jgi:sulfur-oxidizing protein SoxY